jgi:hypothetical protein
MRHERLHHENEHEGRKRGQGLDEARHDRVDDSPVEARERPQRCADADEGDDGGKAHRQGCARTVDETREHVASAVVGTERVVRAEGRQKGFDAATRARLRRTERDDRK